MKPEAAESATVEPTTVDPDSFEPGPLAAVACEREADERWTLVFVRELRHAREKVWAALTEPDQLRQWSPFVADRNLGTAETAVLTMIDGDEGHELPPATITRADPPTLLEYTWGGDVLRWELAATDAGTRLTLRHTVADQGWAAKVAAGWHLCLLVADTMLDGHPIAPIRGTDALRYGWERLDREYAQRLGITSDGWPRRTR